MAFPATRYSAVQEASSDDRETRARAWDRLAEAYWQPVFSYVSRQWHADEQAAKDLTQGFFAAAIAENYFAGYDPAKARFRTYLRICLDGYVLNARKAASRVKRGGGAAHVSLTDFDAPGGATATAAQLAHELVSDGARGAPGSSLDDFFRDEWVRSIFTSALSHLRALAVEREKLVAYELFARYDLEEAGRDPEASYPKLAAEFGIPATQVTNYLAWSRREFRRIVLDHLREITASDQEFREEARALLGISL